jgi:hypothetical protein
MTSKDKTKDRAAAGSHEWGYVEPWEAAWEILKETAEPVLDDMKRHIELGLEAEALQKTRPPLPQDFLSMVPKWIPMIERI